MAALAGEEAVSEAKIGEAGAFPGPLFLGMPPVELEWPQRQDLAQASGSAADITYADILKGAAAKDFSAMQTRFLFGSVGDHLADRFGTKGAPISISTACATGATRHQLAVGRAIAAARPMRRSSSAPTVRPTRNRWRVCRRRRSPPAMTAPRPPPGPSPGIARASSWRKGRSSSNPYEHATARGATILGVVEGCGEMADSFHRTRSSPDGAPIIGCIKNALEDAGVTPADVQYVNAHGTSTPENDKMEYVGLSAVFGGSPRQHRRLLQQIDDRPYASAAGAIEAVFTLMTIRNGVIPPTINQTEADPTIKLDLVPNVARKARVTRAISNSFGFGGQNVWCSLRSLSDGTHPRHRRCQGHGRRHRPGTGGLRP